MPSEGCEDDAAFVGLVLVVEEVTGDTPSLPDLGERDIGAAP